MVQNKLWDFAFLISFFAEWLSSRISHYYLVMFGFLKISTDDATTRRSFDSSEDKVAVALYN